MADDDLQLPEEGEAILVHVLIVKNPKKYFDVNIMIDQTHKSLPISFDVAAAQALLRSVAGKLSKEQSMGLEQALDHISSQATRSVPRSKR